MKRKDDPRWAYALVNLSTLLWASNFILGRMLREEIGPLTLTAARFTIAALLYGPLLARLIARNRLPRSGWLAMVGMAMAGIFGFSGLLYRGLQLTTATNAALINGTGPLMTAVLAAILLSEKLLGRYILGAFVSLAGVTLIISGGSFQVFLQWQVNTGDLLILFGVGLWGLYSVFGRVATRSLSALSATALSTYVALPLLLMSAAFEWQRTPPILDGYVMLAILYIGIFPSVVAYLAWNEGVRRVGPSRAMAFYNMLPVFGSIFGVILLGEPFGWSQLTGGTLVIAGSLISVWPDLMRKKG
jgi:drug/metabolite transporter (DMT)-like permease